MRFQPLYITLEKETDNRMMGEDNKELLTVSASPHTRSDASVRRIMLDVILALTPTLIAGIVIFGFRAAVVVAVCVGCAPS